MSSHTFSTASSTASIVDEAAAELAALGEANRAFMRIYPGDRAARQPVHTVYGGAQLYRFDTTKRLGELALRSLATYGRDPFELAVGVGIVPGAALAGLDVANVRADLARDASKVRREQPAAWLAVTVYDRVLAKLQSEPVEDFRIDFEDGFGARSDEEEDATAIAAAHQVVRGMTEGTLPPFLGIRIKSFGEEWKLRGARTLELFVDTVLRETGGKLPDNFVVTLPKVTVAEQPRTLVKLLEILERRHGLPHGSLQLEIMIEVTQALLGVDGRSPLPGFLEACAGRCTGAHLGTYDFTASCSITAAYQTMDHPMCDLAKGMMTLAYAGTGIFLSDGATNVMPVGPHKEGQLTPAQADQNRAAVHSAWQLASRHTRHSLIGGFYQGWDLHPAQLPVRYATCYAFFLEGFAQAAERLSNFVEKSAQATLVGDVFDDAATGQGLLNYFLRALNCGAITLDDVALTGLTPEEFGLRSFAKILAARRTRLGTADSQKS
jgi:citrate lyase beta subunit